MTGRPAQQACSGPMTRRHPSPAPQALRQKEAQVVQLQSENVKLAKVG